MAVGGGDRPAVCRYRAVQAAGADFIWGVARQSGLVGERISVTLTGAFSVSAIVT